MSKSLNIQILRPKPIIPPNTTPGPSSIAHPIKDVVSHKLSDLVQQKYSANKFTRISEATAIEKELLSVSRRKDCCFDEYSSFRPTNPMIRDALWSIERM